MFGCRSVARVKRFSACGVWALVVAGVVHGRAATLASPAKTVRGKPAARAEHSHANPGMNVTSWFSLAQGATGSAIKAPNPDRFAAPTESGVDFVSVYARRRDANEETWRERTLAGEQNSSHNLFNAGGDAFKAPSYCPGNYTTIAGQPAEGGDREGPVGVVYCYY
jgi:hypothetical protein